MKKYEKENVMAVETIYGLIDFDKFKESILRYKMDSLAITAPETNDSLGKQNQSIFYTYDKEDPEDPKTGWVKKQDTTDEKNGYSMTLHQKPSSGPVNIMRLNMVLKGIKESTFIDYLQNFDK